MTDQEEAIYKEAEEHAKKELGHTPRDCHDNAELNGYMVDYLVKRLAEVQETKESHE